MNNTAVSSDHTPSRTLYLPLKRLDRCFNCGKPSKAVKLRICGACGEATYCSDGCQRADWKSHKTSCGETDRVNLESFYPLLALLRHHFHTGPHFSVHPALKHQIVNDPLSPSSIAALPNGLGSRLLLLGDPLSGNGAFTIDKWWPSSPSPQAGVKLMKRIINEGMVLPSVFVLATALAAEIYTTTSRVTAGKVEGRRVRLSYNNSPISDIGIVHGSVRVTNQDRLAYYNFTTDEFWMGQDPEDHYWMYFTTLAGDEYFLDCGLFNFNFCTMVSTSQYGAAIGMSEVQWAPAFFCTHHYEPALPFLQETLFRPKKKVSILRDERLHDFMNSGGWAFCDDCDVPNVLDVMSDISGRSCSSKDLELVKKLIPEAIQYIRLVIRRRAYLAFPTQPQITIDMTPGENRDPTGEKAEDLYAHLTKWSRKLKRGKITPERWHAAFKKYTDVHRVVSGSEEQALQLSRVSQQTAKAYQTRSSTEKLSGTDLLLQIFRIMVCICLLFVVPLFLGKAALF